MPCPSNCEYAGARLGKGVMARIRGASLRKKRLRYALLFIVNGLSVFSPTAVHAYIINISSGARAIYLQIGDGTYVGGNYNDNGRPANNSTVNVVSVSVPAASIGNGTALAMTSNSAASNSFIDGYAFCNAPDQVYIGSWVRTTNGSGTATLSVTTPVNLTSGSDTIPFSQISWTISGNGDTSYVIPSGTFTGGSQTLTTVSANTWKEQCMAFSYANRTVVPAGTYQGRAVYTVSLP